MQLSGNKLKKISEVASKPTVVSRIHDVVKSLEGVVEASWLTLEEVSSTVFVLGQRPTMVLDVGVL
jgi:hypothetical protein